MWHNSVFECTTVFAFKFQINLQVHYVLYKHNCHPIHKMLSHKIPFWTIPFQDYSYTSLLCTLYKAIYSVVALCDESLYGLVFLAQPLIIRYVVRMFQFRALFNIGFVPHHKNRKRWPEYQKWIVGYLYNEWLGIAEQEKFTNVIIRNFCPDHKWTTIGLFAGVALLRHYVRRSAWTRWKWLIECCRMGGVVIFE